MSKILILTVGGSCAPIIHAIHYFNPDYVYFVVSSGAKGTETKVNGGGDPCGDKTKTNCPECKHQFYSGNPNGKSIAVQANLNDAQYEVCLLHDPDDLDECYSILKQINNKIQKEDSNADIFANFTGGTKIMSSALAFYGIMNPSWQLSLNVGKRSDTIKVTSGDIVVPVEKWQIFCEQRISEAQRALVLYNYEMAESIFSEFLAQRLEKEYRIRLQEWINVCKAFKLWDRFNHQQALPLLEQYGGRHYSDYIIMLKKLLKTAESPDYEWVSDLINNAERKAAQGRYDDAVGRLYRATELFGQIRLKEVLPKSNLGKLMLQDLPDKLQDTYKIYIREENQLLMGLCEVYVLLQRMNDPVGDVFEKMKNRILDALKKRNHSILAHGLIPLNKKDYHDVKNALCSLITQSVEAIHVDLTLKQLPDKLIDVN